jgi:uncharacterized membrane protein YjfL (UPF0719 family)
MDWQERERLLFTGFPLALIPALAFLPLFEHLVMEPSLAHSKIICCTIFPLMAVAEIFGVSRVVRSFVRQPFDLITAVAWGTMCILIVIAIYTGIFFAVFAARR